jgi:NAD(P)-dependent dehydrogenase (short-subunit alcohol dehydrogenase family)
MKIPEFSAEKNELVEKFQINLEEKKNMRLEGKVAIVTGASSGIGAGTALEFGLEGAKVCCVGHHSMTGAEAVADQINREMGADHAIAVKMDVTRYTDVETAVARVHKKWGSIDILVNNAGILYMKNFLEHSEEIWDNTMAVNVKGYFLCAKAVTPYMMEQKSGKIINVGSIFGHNGVQGCLAYGVSKMAIHGFTRMLSVELAPYNIKVNAIAPGNIITPINTPLYETMSPKGDVEEGKRILAEKYYPIGRLGEVRDISRGMVYLASEDSDFVTGTILFIDGGYSAP